MEKWFDRIITLIIVIGTVSAVATLGVMGFAIYVLYEWTQKG